MDERGVERSCEYDWVIDVEHYVGVEEEDNEQPEENRGNQKGFERLKRCIAIRVEGGKKREEDVPMRLPRIPSPS